MHRSQISPVVLGALLALSLAGCDPAGADRADPGTDADLDPVVKDASAIRVEVAKLAPSEGRLTRTWPAEVLGSRDAMLGAALGGYVEAVLVEEGETVRRGAVLARVDTSTYEAQLTQARAQADLATSELERVQVLGDMASPSQLQQVQTQADVARAQARLAEVRVGRSRVTAPFAGVVGQVQVEEGEVLGPGAPLLRLVKLDPVHLEVSVPDRDVVALEEGMSASVVAEATGTRYDGTLINISPVADLSTRAFAVEVEVANPDGDLLPGMIAQVSVSTELVSDALLLPQDWVVTRLDGLGVFVEEGGEARWQPIEVGEVVRNQVEVLEGLEVGDRVVTVGHRSLVEGDDLLVSRTGTCCENGRIRY